MKNRTYVFFDISIGNVPSGRIIFELYNDIVPKTCENFKKKFNKIGLLAMVNFGANSNSSQFFINTQLTGWLNGRHVIFGEVKKGMDVVKKIEMLGSLSGKPRKPIVIDDCGEIRYY